MSYYDPVTPVRLQHLLARLGRECRYPGRVYLVGGTGLLYLGLKALTKDIDLSSQVGPSNRDSFDQILRRLSQELNLAIEEVSPADFIPLPRDAESRHRYLGREGQLEIFAFDPISTSLAKIARSRPADIADVLALVRANQLDLNVLSLAFAEILPQVEAGHTLKIGPIEYRQKMMGFLDAARVEGYATTDGDLTSRPT